ncbi:MAG TPA: family 16 glycoside hydrolase [Chitinophagaceae bacterium]|jgi:3-keto-disaccharide hydrolase|nr:family 16 glycoside hydrolase [Chitinophagaceae bacterium]
MKNKYFLTAGFLLTIFYSTVAQTVKVPLTLEAWDTLGVNPVVETYKGKECFLLKSGGIILKNAELRDGTIEADISFPPQRNFPGFAVRMQDLKNGESFYVRPHQSGNPDATQYTPVFNGQAGWQLYYGEGYSGAFRFRFNEWHHVRIELHGLQAEFYIDDTLVIKVKELLTGWKAGKIAIVAESAPLRVANVQYTIKQGPAPTPMPVPANGTGGVITQWQVSNVVNRRLFEKLYQLTPEIKTKLTWTTQSSEPSGTINLARFGIWADTANTMVAKMIIESTTDQVKELSFGFSDFVTVYLNDRALYYGADNFMSRDYRFLGTIGYFDKLFLPLKKGTNELWFVVSENFGGWGAKAKFESMEGITLK